MVKNVTITVEEQVLRWARRQAADEDTSVSRWVGQILAEQMERSRDQKRILGDLLELLEDVPAGTGYGQPITRDEVYTRGS